MALEEKKIDVDFVDEDFKEIGFFYIFSKFWLPVIIFGVLSIGGLIAIILFLVYLYNHPLIFIP